jgi:regulator of replication initiation timing
MEISYNGQKRTVIMGTFQHSMEREFALTANKKAIAECTDLEGLKKAATNLLEGWSAMQTASQSMMLENIQLRQALDQKQNDLLAAEQILNEAASMVDAMKKQCERQSKPSIWRLLPW